MDMKNTACKRGIGSHLLIFVLISVLFIFSRGYAEEQSDILNGQNDIKARLANMTMLMQTIDNLNADIEKLQTALQSQSGIGREQNLRAEILGLSDQKEEMEATFNQLATDVDTRKDLEDKKAGVDWQSELKELVGPLIREVKKITAHPREIERLRNQVEKYETQLPKAKKAIKNIDILLPLAKEEQLVQKLKQTRRFWQNRLDEIQTRMDINSRMLERKLDQRKTFSESAREVMQIFFKSRGRNLIVSFLAFVLTVGVFFYLHGQIRKISPIHRNERSIYTRLFDVVYYLLTVIFALLSIFGVLYIFGDWLLLSIAAIFLIGIGWASKMAIPLVWVQARLLLNLGPVREGEVVVYKGLPYEVATLNLYTTLVNKTLDGGRIRIPIKDLLDMRSRPITENEPWFPCERGDWVKLDNGTHGKVIVQTPESVKLQLLGGAVVTLKTGDFLSLFPVNLSNGFRLSIEFGLDYACQGEITERIPRVFTEELAEGLKSRGFEKSMVGISVQFKTAGLNSLDLEIMADFNGASGPDYNILQRAISGICVDICNRNRWEIPFSQVCVHMAK